MLARQDQEDQQYDGQPNGNGRRAAEQNASDHGKWLQDSIPAPGSLWYSPGE
jgi:hypothetical protein